MSGIKKMVWIIILGGMLMCFFYIYPAEFEIMDKLQSSNTTWTSANTTLAEADPHGEVLANWYPYLIFASFVGAIIWSMVYIARKGDRR